MKRKDATTIRNRVTGGKPVWLVRERFHPGVRFANTPPGTEPGDQIMVFGVRPVRHVCTDHEFLLVAWRGPGKSVESTASEEPAYIGWATIAECKDIFGTAPTDDLQCIRIG